jgi:CsoR family transcriptional regulator, copper-sensing transcriptional repressor
MTTTAHEHAGCHEQTDHQYGYHAQRDALIKRLHRIEGQVRGIERMVATDRYCIDILTQVSAVSTALDSLAFLVLDEHVRHCVAGALTSGDELEAQAKAEELLAAVHRFAKTQ